MAGHRAYSSPVDLDVRDPDFPAQFLLWKQQVQCEIVELIAGSRETIAISQALLKEADRLLALR